MGDGSTSQLPKAGGFFRGTHGSLLPPLWPQAFFLENVSCVEGEAPGEGTGSEALLGVGGVGVGWVEAVLP